MLTGKSNYINPHRLKAFYFKSIDEYITVWFSETFKIVNNTRHFIFIRVFI